MAETDTEDEMIEMRSKCRVWWPKNISLSDTSSSKSFLFGWFVSASSSDSLDVVVAFSCNEASISSFQSDRIEEVLGEIDGRMPVALQEKSVFSLLGYSSTELRGNGPSKKAGLLDDYKTKLSSCGNESVLKKNQRTCGCHKHEWLSEPFRKVSTESSCWVQLVYDSQEKIGRNMYGIPRLHHIHWNGQIVSQCDVHVILYEIPTYGSHHFSLHLPNSRQEVKSAPRKPKWVDELLQKKPLIDMDMVILAINSAKAATMSFQRPAIRRKSFFWWSSVFMFWAFTWHLLAVFVASLSTLFYILIQFFHRVTTHTSNSWLYNTSVKVFSTTRINIQIRCSQILYWPIFLQDNDNRSLSCVEYAEKAALHKHSMWSSLAADLLLGNLIGLILLYHAESVCFYVLNFADDVTNELLRTGCVWLMGVPAGFKLNTELAGVLGMISLNATQIWSTTLWVFVGLHFIFFIQGLAVLGIIFGVTIPAALVVDLISLATLHVSTLHWLISRLYSTQLQALASLWRLFRGRKWNPLRQRLDSYDYSVKQHIVGSLLFTPLLLLIPTTSVFYIFFSMVGTTIGLICMLIKVAISIVHATPYIKIFLWLVRPRIFPCGIWFENLSCQGDGIGSFKDTNYPSENFRRKGDLCQERSFMVSFLHSNFLTLGKLVLPHYKNIFSGISGSFVAASAYGVLTGKRIESSTMVTDLPSPLPWMFIPYREYWCLCRDSIISRCRT